MNDNNIIVQLYLLYVMGSAILLYSYIYYMSWGVQYYCTVISTVRHGECDIVVQLYLLYVMGSAIILLYSYIYCTLWGVQYHIAGMLDSISI